MRGPRDLGRWLLNQFNMGWIRNHAVAISLGLFLVSSVLCIFVGGYIGLALYSAFATGSPMIGALSALVVPYGPLLAVLLIIMSVSAIVLSWKSIVFGWRHLQQLTMPKSDRLSIVAEHIEKRYPIAADLDLAEIVSPPESSSENALEELKRQYIEGNLTEQEFERKLTLLVDNRAANDTVERDQADTSNEQSAVLSKAWNKSNQ